jgi:3-dehydroquinate synthase
MTVAGDLAERLAALNAHRHDLVVGFGGGVVTDVAGFVASTYARGMNVLHVPTTLLGQVDASIGGKTGVNLEAGKNLVGTFHQPIAVVCDVDVLASCPIEELRAGMAEVVKYGFISDPDLLPLVEERVDEMYAGDAKLLVDVVARCASIKASIVSADEREQGSRAFLNYGHTFAHAIEKARAFSGIRHGEAVALGMMAAAYLAQELGRIDESVVALHERVLRAAGLPTQEPFDLPELEDAWVLDKKYRQGVRFVLLNGVGRPEAGIEAPRDALATALKRMSR